MRGCLPLKFLIIALQNNDIRPAFNEGANKLWVLKPQGNPLQVAPNGILDLKTAKRLMNKLSY